MAANRAIEAGRAFMRLLIDDQGFKRDLTGAEKRLNQFARTASNIGSGLQSAGTRILTTGLAAGGGLGLAVKTFADFDDQARTVGAVSQATGEEFQRLSQQAKDLGASTSFTAVQVAELQAELGRAGFSPDQIIGLTAAVLDLSRATGTETALTSGIFAATIRQFGLEADDATRVADALTTAANKSFNTLESLGESLSYAGPVAADLNMSLEETLAILGALGNVGIQGSNAGTALRRLGVIGAAEAKKLQEVFGVAFVDSAGNARRLVDALDEVATATNNLPTAERAEKFNAAFGLLGITSASAISKSIVGVRDLENALNNAEGAARKTAEAMDAGIGGAIRRLTSAAEGMGIAIGEALAPLASAGAERLTELANGIRSVSQNNSQLADNVTAGTAVVVGFGGALLGAGTALRVVAFAARGFSPILRVVVGLMQTLGAGAAAGPIGFFGALAASIGAAAAAVIRARAAISTARADQEAATPIGDLTEVDKLRQKLEQLSEQDTIDDEGFTQAASAVASLEAQFGPLGIAIDQTAGTITGLEQAFASIDAQRQLQNAEESLADIREQMDAIRNGGGTPAQLVEMEAKFRYFQEVAREAREAIEGIGELQPTLTTGAEREASSQAAEQAAVDEQKVTDLAKSILDKISQLNVRDGAGTFGGRDLSSRTSRQVVDIAQLSLREQKTTNTNLQNLIEYIKRNPGLIGA